MSVKAIISPSTTSTTALLPLSGALMTRSASVLQTVPIVTLSDDRLKELITHFIRDFLEFLNECVLMILDGRDSLDIQPILLNYLDNIVRTGSSHWAIS